MSDPTPVLPWSDLLLALHDSLCSTLPWRAILTTSRLNSSAYRFGIGHPSVSPPPLRHAPG